MDGSCSKHGGMKNVFKILFQKPEGRRPLGRLRCRREYSIRMDLREAGWESVNGMIMT
jgi:hypothetical protein